MGVVYDVTHAGREPTPRLPMRRAREAITEAVADMADHRLMWVDVAEATSQELWMALGRSCRTRVEDNVEQRIPGAGANAKLTPV